VVAAAAGLDEVNVGQRVQQGQGHVPGYIQQGRDGVDWDVKPLPRAGPPECQRLRGSQATVGGLERRLDKLAVSMDYQRLGELIE
jgi:hypothetical protein